MLNIYDKTEGWLRAADFAFNSVIEENFDQIKAECMSLFEKNLIAPHDQSQQHPSSALPRLASQWDAFFIRENGSWLKAAREHTPFTVSLLESIPEIARQAAGRIYFSIIPAGVEVRRHVSKLSEGTRARHQLCIETEPTATVDNLYLEVNGDKRTWTLGKVISFDDAFPHMVKNATEHRRIVLLFDSFSQFPSRPMVD